MIQSLADIQPDVDAVFRLTKKTPFNFNRPEGPALTQQKIIQLPHHTFAPYNAQATVHHYDSFWALLLPITVPGRVSDIWRSYFAQALFPLCNLHLGFLPRPVVVQDRNPHNILADFQVSHQWVISIMLFMPEGWRFYLIGNFRRLRDTKLLQSSL